MSEFQKVIISFVLLILLCIGCFFGGYLLSNSRAIKRINDTNTELAEQQRKYDELIKSTDERIRNIRIELSQQISNNGKATEELSGIIEQIRKQKLNIKI